MPLNLSVCPPDTPLESASEDKPATNHYFNMETVSLCKHFGTVIEIDAALELILGASRELGEVYIIHILLSIQTVIGYAAYSH